MTADKQTSSVGRALLPQLLPVVIVAAAAITLSKEVKHVTGKQEIQKLLTQVPDEAVPQVIGFLKALAAKRAPISKLARTGRKRTSIAQQTFGLIPASAAIVQQVLAEDLYEAE